MESGRTKTRHCYNIVLNHCSVTERRALLPFRGMLNGRSPMARVVLLASIAAHSKECYDKTDKGRLGNFFWHYGGILRSTIDTISKDSVLASLMFHLCFRVINFSH